MKRMLKFLWIFISVICLVLTDIIEINSSNAILSEKFSDLHLNKNQTFEVRKKFRDMIKNTLMKKLKNSHAVSSRLR